MRCGLCNQEFKNKKQYQSHTLCCEVIKKNDYFDKKTDKERIPSKENMYELIKYLMVKCNKLENEVMKIKQYTKREKQKINVMDWLNATTQEGCNDLMSEIKDFEISKDMLETIFTLDNYCCAVYYVFTNIFKVDTHEQHQIRSFEQKTNTIYYLNADRKWEVLSFELFKKVILKIDRKLIKLFNVWIEENKDKIENDDVFNSLYLKYTKIIMGDEKTMTREKALQRIYYQVYNYLKCNIKSVIKYEYEF